MDYYEELGVGRSASVDEIRNSYKRLARLFHPDHCAEASARALAEVQMKRLNAMVATLLDPSERQRYDLGLAAGSRRFDSAVSRPNRSRRRGHRRRNSAAPIWPVCCVILAGALLFVFAKPENQPQTTTAPLPVVIAKAPSAVDTRLRVRSLRLWLWLVRRRLGKLICRILCRNRQLRRRKRWYRNPSQTPMRRRRPSLLGLSVPLGRSWPASGCSCPRAARPRTVFIRLNISSCESPKAWGSCAGVTAGATGLPTAQSRPWLCFSLKAMPHRLPAILNGPGRETLRGRSRSTCSPAARSR